MPQRTHDNGQWVNVGNSYTYNANWHNGPQNFWVHYQRRMGSVPDHSRQISIADATISYAWAYGDWFPSGPYLAFGATAYHDPPYNHPDQGFYEGTYHDVWFYDSWSNVGFLDGHVSFIMLGPYGHPGNYSFNTDEYVLDPFT